MYVPVVLGKAHPGLRDEWLTFYDSLPELHAG